MKERFQIGVRKLGQMVRRCGPLIVVVSFAALLIWVAPLRTAFQFGGDEGYELSNDYECLFSAVAGTGLILWQRRWRHLFPVVLLGTVVLIHLTHRPYWYFEADYAPSPNADMKGSYLLKTVLAEPRGNGSRSRITTPGQQPMR